MGLGVSGRASHPSLEAFLSLSLGLYGVRIATHMLLVDIHDVLIVLPCFWQKSRSDTLSLARCLISFWTLLCLAEAKTSLPTQGLGGLERPL